MMPLGVEAIEILDEIPVEQRVDFVLHSNDPKLKSEKEWLINRLKEINEKDCDE